MTCSGCVRTVETVLKNSEGVQEVKVELEGNQADITFEEDTTSPTVLADKLQSLGYTLHID